MKRYFVIKSHVNNSYYVVWDYQEKKVVSRMYPTTLAPLQIAGFKNNVKAV